MAGKVHFDRDTPLIVAANKVKSLLAIDKDTGVGGEVGFDMLVFEAGKNVGSSVKISGTVLPALGSANKEAIVFGGTTGKTFTFGSTTITVSANCIARLFGDVTAGTWENVNEEPLPTVPGEGVFNPSSPGVANMLATAQYFQPFINKLNSLIGTSIVSDIAIDVNNSASIYGHTSGVYGWGFPLKARKRISKVAIKIGVNTGISTSQKLVIKEDGKDGEVLLTKNYTQIISGLDNLVEFDFSDSEIANTENKNLWVELYSNVPIGIYRVNPGTVFTSSENYPFPRYSTTNDMGASPLNNGSSSSYYDVYHEIFYKTDGAAGLTEWFVDQIAEIINQEVEFPSIPQVTQDIEEDDENNVPTSGGVVRYVKPVHQKILEIVDNETIDNHASDISNSAGIYGYTSGIYGWGFPLKARKRISKVAIKIGVNTGNSTSQKLIIKEENKDGAVLLTKSFTHTIGGLNNLVEFDFSEIANVANKKLWCELYSNVPIGIYRVNPATVFTSSENYPFPRYSTTNDMGASPLNNGSSSSYYDVYHEIFYKTIGGKNFTTWAKDKIRQVYNESSEIPSNIAFKLGVIDSNFNNITEKFESVDAKQLINENIRISFVGSSVTWGDGYLQSGYVAEYIKWRQTEVATSVLASNFTNGTIENNRKHFLSQAIKLTGVGTEIEFELSGNEISIIQSIERSNLNASEIEVYVDNILHDTFNNYNPSPIGSSAKNFTGDGTAVMFDLGQAFTFNHTVSVNGVNKVVTHNVSQGTGFTIPAESDCGIIRKLGVNEAGKTQVTHWLWFKSAPAVGQSVSVNYNYGQKLTYESTTIGENTEGVVECPYGDGNVSFDPLAPAGIGTGLDFRQTDERVVKTYRFTENKKRKVKLKIKGNYAGATGTPYFTFNFATNRFFHFQNAGIGGWHLWNIEKSINQDYLRGWQRVVQFNPNKIVLECTPNDDWLTMGYKLYTTKNVGLSELRSIKNMPLRSIAYQSVTDTYDLSIWKGHITGISETSVTFSATVDTPIVAGDMVMIGQYWSNNHDYITRKVSSVVGSTIYFDQPIKDDEIIYDSIHDFIGKEINIRSLNAFKVKLESVIDKIRGVTDAQIHLLENPMPTVLGRDLWAYPMLMKDVAITKYNVYTLDYSSLRIWQNTQKKTSITLNLSSAIDDLYLGKKVIEFGSNGQNTLATDVLMNGVSIYGTRAVVQNGWAYTVNQSNSGSSLNKAAGNQVQQGQVFNQRKPRVVILDPTLTTGTITVKYASSLWSADSCHMNANSSKLYADFLKDI